MSRQATCESCGESVRWGVTTLGARMPLDPAPAPPGEGTVWINEEGRFRVLNRAERERAVAKGVELYESHFFTCVAANRHRSVSRQQLSLGL